MADKDRPTPGRTDAQEGEDRRRIEPEPGARAVDRAGGSSAEANAATSGETRAGAGQGTAPRRPVTSPRRPMSTLLTWGTVAVVIVVVIVLVVVKLTSSDETSGGTSWQAAPASVVSGVTHIPASVYDKVGIKSAAADVAAPLVVHGEPPLTLPDKSGAVKPGLFYYGAEYCPYCAAERWALAAALSRFGRFVDLGMTVSSATDDPVNIHTLTFAEARYSSPYLTFSSIERYTNEASDAGGFTDLQMPDAQQTRLIDRYDSARYFGGHSSSYPMLPFIDIGNQVLQLSSNFSPVLLQGATQEQIAAALDDPKDPITQAIVATANYLTASICRITDQRPTPVCTSKGVQEAARAMTTTPAPPSS